MTDPDPTATPDPVEPTSVPGEPASERVEPTSAPGGPASERVEPTSAGGEPVSDPVEVTSAEGGLASERVGPESERVGATSGPGGPAFEPTGAAAAEPVPAAPVAPSAAPRAAESAPAAGDAPALELRDVSAGYGPFRALFGLSFAITPGRSLALVGPNGAGKTTVARLASGLIAPTEGKVLVGGQDLTGADPYRFARAGIAHAPEGRSVFATLTVEENLTLSFRRTLGRAGVKDGLARAYELFPAIERRRRQHAGDLSGGEQRMLAMARVMVEAPKVLVADELSLGLAPIIVERTYESLHRLAEQGTALLIIEQHVSHALELCDDVAILDHGAIGWTGPSAEAGARVATQLA